MSVVLAVALAGAAARLLGLSWPFGSGEIAVSRMTPKTAMLSKVIDGDTIVVTGGEKIRLLSVNTPERGQPFSRAATRRTRELIGDGRLSTTTCASRPTDDFGRTLGFVEAGGRDVALALVGEGLGYVFSDAACMTPEQLDRYWTAALDAYRNRRGLWRLALDAPLPASELDDYAGYTGFVCGSVASVRPRGDGFRIVFAGPSKTTVSIDATRAARLREQGVALDPSLVGQSLLVFARVFWDGLPAMSIDSTAQWLGTADCSASLR